MTKPQAWTQRDVEEARLLHRKLCEVINSTQPFSQESLRAVAQLCDRAVLMVDDEHCPDMFCEVERYAQALVTTGQRDQRMIWITLDALEHRLTSLGTLRSSAELVAASQAILSKS